MDNLIKSLSLRRLCLPSDTNYNILHSGKIKNVCCLEGNSNHISICYKGRISEKKLCVKILSYGSNIYDNCLDEKNKHAEVSAINNLPFRPKKKRNLDKINILVIRVSITGKLGNSKPCFHCLLNMKSLSNRGYIIKNILYSNENEEIVKTTLNKIINEGNFHFSKYYKRNNYIK